MDQSRENIERAQARLGELLGGGEWDDACERAAGVLARLMFDAGIDRSEILRRLRSTGVSKRGAGVLLRAAVKAKSSEERRAHEAELAGATPVCPHCLAPVKQFERLCPKCREPITAYGSVFPLARAHPTGTALDADTSCRPRFIVFLGVWLFLGPQVLVLLFMLPIFIFAPESRSREYFSFLGTNNAWGWILGPATVVGMLLLYTIALCLATVRWCRRRRQAAENDQAEAGEQ